MADLSRLWNLLQANEAANAFTVFLFEGPPPPPPPGKQINLLRWLLDPTDAFAPGGLVPDRLGPAALARRMSR